MTTLTNRPWPFRTKNQLWGPYYRIALRSNENNPQLLLITESGFKLSTEEAITENISFPAPLPNEPIIEVGLARSDLPKELSSSWKLHWVSFPRNGSWIDDESDGDSHEQWQSWFAACSPGANIPVADMDVIIFGSFVHTIGDSNHWVEVTRGVLQEIRCDRNNWVHLLITTPPAHTWSRQEEGFTKLVMLDLSRERAAAIEARSTSDSSNIPTEPRDLKITLVMMATLAVWVFKVVHFFVIHYYYAAAVNSGPSKIDYGFFNLLHTSGQGDWFGHIVVAGFIIIHHLRMSAGVEFAGRDSSFFRAKLHAPVSTRTSREWIESILLAVIVSCSVLLTYVVSNPDYIWTVLLLFFQGILLVLYDWVFKDAMLIYDEDKKANKYLVRGDRMFLGIVGVILINRLLYGPVTGPAFTSIRDVMLLFCGLYCGLFFFEVIQSYKSALGSAIREFKVALKHLTNRDAWVHEKHSSREA